MPEGPYSLWLAAAGQKWESDLIIMLSPREPRKAPVSNVCPYSFSPLHAISLSPLLTLRGGPGGR